MVITMTENRTLVFSFDGTGNEPSDAGEFKEDESISNILKLHIMMGGGFHLDKSNTKNPNGHQQITYYYNGIGTRESIFDSIPLIGSLASKAKQSINMSLAPTFGDAKRILREAMSDFEKLDCKKGDTLVVFGFSRGAALARKFAGMILKKNKLCEVSFLGVFDTVAAMDGIHRKGEKIHSDVVFENGTLNKRIIKAVHIVSLDEDRIPFEPTLINKDNDNSDRILEVWFPGVHSDIGGGYWFDGLSDVALEFMIVECKKTLGNRIFICPNDNAKIDELLQKQGDELSAIEVDDIAINPMTDGLIHRHSELLAKAGGKEPRPVRININDRASEDLPIVHHFVKERFEHVPSYRPPALRGLKFILLLADGKRKTIHGISELRTI